MPNSTRRELIGVFLDTPGEGTYRTPPIRETTPVAMLVSGHKASHGSSQDLDP